MLVADLEYFQDVQNAYATLTNLHCIITDKVGNPVTQLMNDANVFHLVYDRETFKNELIQWTRDFAKINGPIVYDALPGVKVIICPVSLHGEIEFFIFAGCLLEASSKNSVQTYFERILNNTEKANTIFSLIQEYSPDEIQAKLQKINKMSEVLVERLTTQTMKADIIKQDENFGEILYLLAEGDIKVTAVLERFLHEHSKVDFVGYARKKGHDQFVIDECILPSASTLKGTVFSMGEGTLGQAAATRIVRFWDHLDLDPRNLFFHQRGIYPKSLFCFPIILEKEVIGIFFGGSSQYVRLGNDISRVGKLTSSLIKVIEGNRFWQKQSKNNLMKMTALNEIFQVMTDVHDVKRILLIMLDLSINLIRGPFVAVIVEQPSRNSYEMVSRGLNADQIENYSSDISNRYFPNKQNKQIHRHQPVEHITGWGSKVLEIPINFRNDCFGFLSIGLRDQMLKEDELSFLRSLTIAGGVSMHLLEASNKVEMGQTVIDLLIEHQEYIDPAHFKQATKAREIIKGFSEFSSYGKINTNAVKYSCYFINYDEQFLLDKIKNVMIIDIVKEYKLVAECRMEFSQASMNVQVLTLVWNYINEDENIDSLSKITGMNIPLLNEFLAYLSRTTIIESEISIMNKQIQNEPKISKHLKLSKREMEVMELVLKGNNNREIAEILYISEHTVKNHMTNIFQKLAVNDRSHAIAKIYQMGLEPEDVS